MREFDFIKNLRQKAGMGDAQIGIGDDCAVIPKDAKTSYVLTTDMLVEGVDFRMDWSPPNLIGHKALAVSISDIAAMGGRPKFALVSIAVPEGLWKRGFADKFFEGWFELARRHHVALIGGDVSRSAELAVDTVLIGEVPRGRELLRSGARPGDQVFVSGSLGGAALGLSRLQSGSRYSRRLKNETRELLLRQLAPEPRVELGISLLKDSIATSCIDISDGLSSDAHHICTESQVGMRLYADRLPVDPAILISGCPDPVGLTLNGGEDFELLFTVPEKKNSALKNLSKKHRLTHIGTVTATVGIIELIDDGQTRVLGPSGYRHF